MNLNDYFDPIELNSEFKKCSKQEACLFSQVTIYTKENKIKNIEEFSLALIGVVNDNEININDSKKGLLKIREYLYHLSSFDKQVKMIDLGNLKQGKTNNDTRIGLRDVIIELITLNIIPIIIGSSEEVLYPNYKAYQKLDKKINLVSVDSRIEIKENRESQDKSALWKILIEDNKSLFFYSNIGYQSHFVNSKITKYLSDQLHFAYRLGYIRSNIKEVEPIFRDADMIGLNIASVRQSEAFGQKNPSPNGYYGEEICQLARYAGFSPKLSSFGIYDYDSNNDVNFQTAHLIAQIIWYYIDGSLNKINEYPLENESIYKKYIVTLNNFEQEIIFYKSEKTDRWWVEVPSEYKKAERSYLISCTYDDYIEAGNGDVPERWLKAFQKSN